MVCAIVGAMIGIPRILHVKERVLLGLARPDFQITLLPSSREAQRVVPSAKKRGTPTFHPSRPD